MDRYKQYNRTCSCRMKFAPPRCGTAFSTFRLTCQRKATIFDLLPAVNQAFITVDDNLQNIPALSFSGGLEANTLSFYSYFFYLDSGAQLQMLDALSNCSRNRNSRPSQSVWQTILVQSTPYSSWRLQGNHGGDDARQNAGGGGRGA